jgi:hypothetical protein
MKNNYIVEDGIIKIILHRRKGNDLITIIDKEDFDKINAYDGTFFAAFYPTSNSFYAKITIYLGMIDGKPKYNCIRLHRIIMDGDKFLEDVDHIDKDTLNNRRNNLRVANRSNNLMNREGANLNNQTGCRNVCLYNGLYLVQMQVNGKNKVLKKFKTVEEANSFANSVREDYYGIYGR